MTLPLLTESIVLIGLPGCGKSTLGQLLATHFGCPYLDTDRCIESVAGCGLQTLIDRDGVMALRHLEARVVASLQVDTPSLISTGGSVVYDPAAMQHLQRLGRVIYLRATEATIMQRLGNYSERGIVRLPEQTLGDVITERLPLYENYAEAVLDVDALSISGAKQALIAMISDSRGRFA